jgi:hypothetical protein
MLDRPNEKGGAPPAGQIDNRPPRARGAAPEPIRTSSPIVQPPREAGDVLVMSEAQNKDWNAWFAAGFESYLEAAAADLNSPIGRPLLELNDQLVDEMEKLAEEAGELIGRINNRLKSATGRLPAVKTWNPDGGVAYEGELYRDGGSLWQAGQDTGQAPGGDHWQCVARAGRDGVDGKSVRWRGAFDVSKGYRALDVVEFGPDLFIARRDAPGLCPGGGWKQLRGPRGERGKTGLRGHKGNRGAAEKPVTIRSWSIDRERYTASPLMSNGEVGAELQLKSMFEHFLSETSE